MTASPEGFPPQDLRSFLELCAGEWLALRSHFDLAVAAESSEDPQAAGSAAAAAGSTTAAPAMAASAPSSPAPDSSVAASSVASPQPADGPGDDQPDWAALLAQASASEAPAEEAWHSSERGELRVAFLDPADTAQQGGLRVTAPGGGVQELHFLADGSFRMAAAAGQPEQQRGQWRLWPDGSLELTLEAPGWRLRERLWFTQPNLRLRSSVEQGADGQPGRARFSSEIRRVSRPAP